MDLYERIRSDMVVALKGGDQTSLLVLRMVVSAIKQFEIDKNVKSPAEADVLQIIQRMIKQHKESIEQFKNGNRQDLVDKEAVELKVLEAYMPEQLGEAELEKIVKDAVSETGAATKADLGKVMKAVMEKARGRCDGKLINQLAMKFLK